MLKLVKYYNFLSIYKLKTQYFTLYPLFAFRFDSATKKSQLIDRYEIMPLSSVFSSLNCASSKSSKLQRRTSNLNKKKTGGSSSSNSAPSFPINNSPIEPTTNSSSPSAPPPYIHQTIEQLPDLTMTTTSKKKLFARMDSTPEGESFWDIGNYKYVLRRCDNGNKLSAELADMITERAKLEEAYAKSLRQWAKKWSDHLDNESAEYGTTKDAWHAFLEVKILTYLLYTIIPKN